MSPSIAYICVFYFGERRRRSWDTDLPRPWESSEIEDSLADLKHQIRTVDNFATSTDKVVFIFNVDLGATRQEEVYNLAKELVEGKNSEDPKREWVVV